MKRGLLLFVCILSLTTFHLKAQSFVVYGDWSFGTSKGDLQSRMSYPGEDRIYLIGNSGGDIELDKTEGKCDSTDIFDVWLVCMDTSYNILWDKSFGGVERDWITSEVLANSNSLIFVCESISDSSCEKSGNNRGFPDYWVCKTDLAGNKLWDKTFGGSFTEHSPHIVLLTTGEYIVCGTSNSPINGDKTVASYNASTDYWAIKLDSNGTKIWDKVYGGFSSEFSTNGYQMALLAIENGNFLLAGSTDSDSSGDISKITRGSKDIWLIKCDSAGNKIWDNRFGGSGDETVNCLLKTTDGGYLLAGSTKSPQDGDVSEDKIGGVPTIRGDAWILKIDSLGNKLWDRRYGGVDDDVAVRVIEDKTQGYIVGAMTESGIGYDISESGFGSVDYWVFKIDTIGNLIWNKRFGGPASDLLLDLDIMPDSSIVVCGTGYYGTSISKTDIGNGGIDYWLTRFKYIPNTVNINQLEFSESDVIISPNPTSDLLSIKLEMLSIGPLTIEIYDLIGRPILKLFDGSVYQSGLKLNHDVSDLSSGVYLVKVIQENLTSKRFIKL